MMNDKDLKRNASGYKDETCYKGITAPPKAGEIWVSKDGTKHWLILQNHGNVCSTLLLGTEQKEGSIMVMGRVPMYTTPVMVGYTFTVYVATFVKKIPDEKLEEIRQDVGKALGIVTVTQDILHSNAQVLGREREQLEVKNAELHDTNIQLMKENETLKKRYDDLADQAASDLLCHGNIIEAQKKEIDRLTVYKEMYMDLIDKLVSVRGGAVDD